MRSTHPRSSNAPEHKVAGVNACRALFLARPDDIRRVYVTEETLPRFKDVLKMCAEQRIAYHVKTTVDLDAVAETVHHDGVLFLAREKGESAADDVIAYVDKLGPAERMALVLLENVKNPHNLGAILRVCAHFGVPFALRAGATAQLSPAAMRTAEGGAEHTRVVDVADPTAAKALLKALHERGFSILATSSHATLDLGKSPLPQRSVVMFGSEGEGLSDALVKLSDDVVAIPGAGALESLNVACASSILLWELWKPAAKTGEAPGRPLQGRSGPGTPLQGRSGPGDPLQGRSGPGRAPDSPLQGRPDPASVVARESHDSQARPASRPPRSSPGRGPPRPEPRGGPGGRGPRGGGGPRRM